MCQAGLYSQGIFRFQLEFPAAYPDVAIRMRFISPIFHPLVDPSNGQVHQALQEKTVSQSLMNLKQLFHCERMIMGKEKPLNREAANMTANIE